MTTSNNFGGSDPIARDAEITTDLAADETPEIAKIKAEIEETRAHMAGNVDAVREKLSPTHLVEEAKDAAKTAAKDVAHSAVDKAKDLAGSAMDAVSSAAGAALATASDAVDSVKEALHIGGDSEYAATAESTMTLDAGTMGTNGVPGSASQVYSAEPGYLPRPTAPRTTSTNNYASGSALAPYLSAGAATGAKVVDTIKLNPLPAALIGVGLGWLLMSAKRQNGGASTSYATRTSGLESYNDEGYGAYQAPSATVYGTGYVGDNSLESDTDAKVAQAKNALNNAKNAASDFASDAKMKAADAASQAKDKAADLTAQAKDKAADLSSTAKDKAADVQAKVSETAAQAKDKASELASTAKDKASDVVGTVGAKASQLGVAAKGQGQQAVSSVDSFVHENPLAAGAIALVVGAAVGLALPGTSKENQLIGPTRDRLVDQAGAQAQEMVGKVQNVAEAALSTAKDNIGQAKGDLGSQITDTFQQAKEAVTDAVKTEAQNQGLAAKPEGEDKPEGDAS